MYIHGVKAVQRVCMCAQLRYLDPLHYFATPSSLFFMTVEELPFFFNLILFFLVSLHEHFRLGQSTPLPLPW